MSSAVAVREVRPIRDVDEPAEERALTPLAAWAQSARQAAAVATSLAKTPFVPKSLRDNSDEVTAANITAAILTGQELGLEPMAAMRSLDVIQGTPALRAVALRAIVLSAGHDMWVVEATETRAIVRGQRRGSEHVQESAWTMDRAKALGLNGKENWRKQPGAMLIARATAECARLVAADAILGVPYTVEEIDDGLDTTSTPVTPTGGGAAGKRQRTAQRRTAPAPATARPAVAREDAPPEPELEPPLAETPPKPDDEIPTATGITKAQSTKLHAVFGDLHVDDRAYKLRIASALVQRPLTSSADLTKDEATSLIDTLESIASRDDAAENLAFVIEAAEAQNPQPADREEPSNAD